MVFIPGIQGGQEGTHVNPVDFFTPAKMAEMARASKVKWKSRPRTMLTQVGGNGRSDMVYQAVGTLGRSEEGI